MTFPHWPCPARPSAGLGTTSQPAANSPARCFATEQWPPPPFPVAADSAGAGIGHGTRRPLVISHRSCGPGLLTPSTPNYVAQSPHAGREPRPSPPGWATAWAPWARPALAAPVLLLCLPQGWGARGSHGCSLFSSPSKRLLSSQENCIPPQFATTGQRARNPLISSQLQAGCCSQQHNTAVTVPQSPWHWRVPCSRGQHPALPARGDELS